MKKMVLMAAVAITVGTAGHALALPTFTVSGVGGGASFNTLGGYTVGNTGGGGLTNQNSGYYWSGYSMDTGEYYAGTKDHNKSATVGNFLTSTGAWGAGGALAGGTPGLGLSNLQAFGSTSSSSMSPVGMTYGAGSLTSGFQIKIEVAGLAGSNSLYYRQGNTLTRIFDGAAGAGQSSSVTITGEFELYIVRGLGSASYANADTALAGAGVEWARSGGSDAEVRTKKGATTTNKQSFASFQQSTATDTIYTGIEDLWPPDDSDNDYNDMIIVMKLEELPAPPALVLAALGIPALGLVRRWTRKTTADAVVA